MKKFFICRFLSVILLCAWAITIFYLSAQNAEKSFDTSGGIVEKIVTVIYPEYEMLSGNTQTEITDMTTLIVRKTAHFLEYFILGLLAFWTTICFLKNKLNVLLSIVFCVLYSVSDEVHQHFVPGRACRFWDIIIDLSGSALAVIVLAVIFKKIKSLGEPNA